MKRIAIVILSMLIAGAVAYADDAKKEIEGNTITITDKINANSEAMMIAVKEGAELADNSSIYAIRYAVSNSEGVVTFTFNMPEERDGQTTDGKYDIYTKQMGKPLGSPMTISYANPGKVEALEAALQGKDWGAVIDAADGSTEYLALETIGCVMSEYNPTTDGELVKSFLDKEFENVTNIDSEVFALTFNNSLFAVKLNSCDEGDVQELLKKNYPTYNGVSYTELTNAEQKWLAQSMYQSRPYESGTQFGNMYEKANQLAVICDFNVTRADSIEKTLDDFAQTLGIDTDDDYKAYKKLSDKGEANDKLIAAIKKSPAYTVSTLLSYIEDALPEKKGSSEGNSGNGSSGSGTSSKKNSSDGFAMGIPVSAPEKKENFKDLDTVPWAKAAIEVMKDKGIVNGRTDGEFAPNDTVTREEFVRMLVVAAGVYNENSECEFEDVARDAWYYRSVASAYRAGLVNGLTETAFGTGMNITRQDLMVLCYRASKTSGELIKVREYEEFADEEEISDYAKEAVNALYTAGIANGMGDGLFMPKETATRAQAALIVYNLFVK